MLVKFGQVYFLQTFLSETRNFFASNSWIVFYCELPNSWETFGEIVANDEVDHRLWNSKLEET